VDITSIIRIIVAFIKEIWGTDKKQKVTVVEAPVDVEITDGKTHEERMSDCGL